MSNDDDMKRGIGLLAIILLLTWLVSEVHIRRRDARYQAALNAYQRDIHPGMTRTEVRNYLRSGNVAYFNEDRPNGAVDSLNIKIGEFWRGGDPFCSAYIRIDFSPMETKTRVWHVPAISESPYDKVKAVSMYKFCDAP